MAQGEKRPLAEARAIAEQVAGALAPYLDKIRIAGSVRRGKNQISDIEIVGIPKPVFDLFGTQIEDTIWFDAFILSQREAIGGVTKHGKRYCQFRWHDVQVDLFLATPDNFGYILMLRTGPAEFSHAMVTQTGYGGFKPTTLTLSDGQVWRGGSPMSVPDEETLFALYEMPYIEPADRDVGKVTYASSTH